MGILQDIVAVKRIEIERLKQKTPLHVLQQRVKESAVPAGRDFRQAIKSGTCAIIAEVKKHSPSKGSLREDIDPGEVAVLYEKSGAAAISVLTEREYFHGSPDYLVVIKKKVTIPVLRKDFIIDPYQIYETKLLGADALLLISGLLAEERLREYIQTAMSLGIWPLVEVHTIADLQTALAAGAEIIGINNRDLQTFKTDINISLALAPYIPPGKAIISASGIANRDDIAVLMQAGIHAFLIGEALMSAPDPG
ncbi:MAG: indole-3-glycerol phosphate synthase TrpC, partial [Deltaproteobacteria bacterium]|nr:indole-3-glycerol phosphate synthase TrpC [Deltaproteobacteria bacterium]